MADYDLEALSLSKLKKM